MLLAENWKEYEVLDTADGEKLERWAVVVDSQQSLHKQ